MIGKARTGADFGGLSSYLTAGGEERVSHVETRHTFEQDPAKVAQEMRDAASLSDRVEKPVYHLSVSFPVEDDTSQDERLEVMDELLEDLGLDDRQALIVEHQDEQHPHVHAMVNRVQHDRRAEDYGTAWDTGHDWHKIEASLRQIEQERGWRQVPGKLAETPDMDREPGDAWTSGQMQYFKRTGELPLIEEVKVQAGEDFEAAESWDELDRALREKGLKIERKGRGGVVRDAVTGDAVKLSSVGREHSLGRLEDRFDEQYAGYLERREEVDERPFQQGSNRQQRGEGPARAAKRPNRGGEAEGPERGGAEEGAGRGAKQDGSGRKQGESVGEKNGGVGQRSREARNSSERGSGRLRRGGRRAEQGRSGEQAGRSHLSAGRGGPENDERDRGSDQKSGGRFSGGDKESVLGGVEESIPVDRDRDGGDPDGDLDPLQYEGAEPLGRAGRVAHFIEGASEDSEAGEVRESVSGAERQGQGDGEGSSGEGREAGEEPREGVERGVGPEQGGGPERGRAAGVGSSEETGDGSSEEGPLEDLRQASGPGPEERGFSRRQKHLIRRLLREDEEEGLFEGIWDQEEAKEVHDYLDGKGREREAKQLSREWEKESRKNISLRGEEGKIRPALSRGDELNAAQAFQKVDDARRDEVWSNLRDREKDQVLHGIAELRRRSVGTQAAYEKLSEEQKAVAVHAQMSGMTGQEDGQVAEGLVEVAKRKEGLSGTVADIEEALPSRGSVEVLHSAFEKANQVMEKGRGGGEDEQSRGGRGR